VWTVVVFDGSDLLDEPQLHGSRLEAERAAHLRASTSSQGGKLPIRRRGSSSWNVGTLQVLAAPLNANTVPPDPWVGVSWLDGTYLVAEPAVLLAGVRDALRWVAQQTAASLQVVSSSQVWAPEAFTADEERAAARRAYRVDGLGRRLSLFNGGKPPRRKSASPSCA
jgi:hypothetical protein